MINQYLTYNKIFLSFITSPLEKVFLGRRVLPSGLKLSNTPNISRAADNKLGYSVNFMQEKKGKSIEKKLIYKHKNLKYHQMLNEASMLEVFSKFKASKKEPYIVSFPKLKSFTVSKNLVTLRREYIEGSSIENLDTNSTIAILDSILKQLNLGRATYFSKIKNFPIRGSFYLNFTFSFYVIRVCFKNFEDSILYMKALGEFYKLVSKNLFRKNKYVLAHRDLHTDNILYRKKEVIVIDTEIASLAEDKTDLAIACRYFYKKIGRSGIERLLNKHAKSKIDRDQFLRISFYYTVQCLATESIHDKFFIEAKQYLKEYLLN